MTQWINMPGMPKQKENAMIEAAHPHSKFWPSQWTRKSRTIVGTIMVATALVAMIIVIPYLLEQRIARKLTDAGVSVYFNDGCPAWIPNDLHKKITVFNRVTKLAFGAQPIESRSPAADSLVTDEGLKHLKKLKNLEEVWISGTKVTNDGVEHLRAVNSLRGLYIRGTQINDAGLARLKQMSNLTRLVLDDTQSTAQERMTLRKALPNCIITPDP